MPTSGETTPPPALGNDGADGSRRASRDGDALEVVLVADPGQPASRAHQIARDTEEELRGILGRDVLISVETDLLRLRPDDTLETGTPERLSRRRARAAIAVMVTEMPRLRGARPIIAEAYAQHGIAVISCPTLGVLTPHRRLRAAVRACILQLLGATDRRTPPREAWQDDEDGGAQLLLASPVIGPARLLTGMVSSNEPLRTAPRLSSALAAASATGAFGIFYNSIWLMADALSTMRLAGIALLAISLMVLWLMLSNRLWDRPIHQGLRRVVAMYNLSTIITLFVVVSLLYMTLFVMILMGGLVVIDPGFMSSLLDEEAQFTNYLDIAWLAASMGVVAGALGASFDSSTDLRKITHGQRERQRPHVDDEDDDPPESEDVHRGPS
ncbi:MAG: hypothetical protein Q4G40_05660 [Brachybacterium sp.]|nr:hypothetical protein [Brachybacterium sp.]